MGKMSSRMQRFTLGMVAVVVSVAFVGCAPQVNDVSDTQGASKGQPAAVDFTWSSDADCAMCHTGEQESYGNAACEASLHKDMACIQCHVDESALQAAHEGKTASDKMPTRLKETGVSDELCFGCHYDNREGLIAATEGSTVLTDTEGTSRNPHDPDGIAEHETLKCSDCHNMHSTDAVQERAMKKCESCHHAGVFACYTCHD